MVHDYGQLGVVFFFEVINYDWGHKVSWGWLALTHLGGDVDNCTIMGPTRADSHGVAIAI